MSIPLIRHAAIFFASINPVPELRTQEALAAAIQGLLVLLPIMLARKLLRHHSLGQVFHAWILAAVFHWITLPGYLAAIDAAPVQLIVNSLAAILMLLILQIKHRASQDAPQAQPLNPDDEQSHAPLLVRSAGITLVFTLSALPWMRIGALGSPMDTLLALVMAACIGTLCANLIKPGHAAIQDAFSERKYTRTTWHLLHAGMTAYLLSSALSIHFSGMQLLLMVLIPFVSVPLTLLAIWQDTNRVKSKTALPALLYSLIISLPLVFLDADELVLVLNSSFGEIFFLAMRAAFYTAVLLLGATLGLRLLGRVAQTIWDRFRDDNKEAVSRGIFIAIIWLCAISLGYAYLHTPQPGFFGERYFVIFKDQASLEPFLKISDLTQRKQAMYSALVQHALQTQTPIRNQLDQWGIEYRSFYLINAMEVEGNPWLRLWLQGRPEVDRLLNSPVLRPLPQPPEGFAGTTPLDSAALWNLASLHVPEAWEAFQAQGEGILIGQADSGVELQHPELMDSYRGAPNQHAFNWYDPWFGASEPVDYNGHGTHTLATILGNQVGIAPKATWIACSNLGRNLANPALYLECMQFLFAPFPPHGDAFFDGHPELGAHILNNSWGCPEIEGCDALTFSYAAQVFQTAGVFFVASAGNDGPQCASLKYPPPIYPQVFAVGAIDSTGNLAEFSSIGPALLDHQTVVKPDLLAPGVDIYSALPDQTYGYLSGTSMAGPHVVGVVALLWSAFPQLIGDIDTTQAILIQSALPYQGLLPECPGAEDYPSTASGYGVLDAYQALLTAQNLLAARK